MLVISKQKQRTDLLCRRIINNICSYTPSSPTHPQVEFNLLPLHHGLDVVIQLKKRLW